MDVPCNTHIAKSRRMCSENQRLFSAQITLTAQSFLRFTLTSSSAEQISEERHGDRPRQSKLELPTQGRRRDESFNQAGKNQDRNHTHQQANSFSSGLGQGVAPRKKTRE